MTKRSSSYDTLYQHLAPARSGWQKPAEACWEACGITASWGRVAVVAFVFFGNPSWLKNLFPSPFYDTQADWLERSCALFSQVHFDSAKHFFFSHKKGPPASICKHVCVGGWGCGGGASLVSVREGWGKEGAISSVKSLTGLNKLSEFRPTHISKRTCRTNGCSRAPLERDSHILIGGGRRRREAAPLFPTVAAPTSSQ